VENWSLCCIDMQDGIGAHTQVQCSICRCSYSSSTQVYLMCIKLLDIFSLCSKLGTRLGLLLAKGGVYFDTQQKSMHIT
jgi:hypothetical protein